MYRPGKKNIADALSRLNSLGQVDHGEDYDLVRAIAASCKPVALSPREIEETSYDDEELTRVSQVRGLGPVYTFLTCTSQGRVMRLW